MGSARDLVGHARHLVDRLDRQAELVVAQPEHQELPLLAPTRRRVLVVSGVEPPLAFSRCMTSSRNSCSGDRIETSRRPLSPR